MPSAHDYDSMIEFLHDLHKLLRHPECVPERFSSQYRLALDELEHHFQGVDRVLSERRYRQRFNDAGLRGNQLRLKLAVFDSAYTRFNQMLTKGSLAAALDAAIIIGESIVKGSPVGEAIVEAAKVAKHEIEHAD